MKHLLTFAAAVTVLLARLVSEPEVRAQIAPPPIIVPQVAPQLNNPGPQVTIPRPGNQVQQRTVATGSQIVPGRPVEPLRRHRHHADDNRYRSRNHSSTKQRRATSRQHPSDQQQPKTSRASQEQEHTPADERLKQLDDALSKKLKSICRGC